MKLSFPLAVQDYLDYQLYTVTRSEKAMRKRLIGRLLFPIIYLIVQFDFGCFVVFLLSYQRA